MHSSGHRSKDRHFPSVAFYNRELQVLHFLIHVSITPFSQCLYNVACSSLSMNTLPLMNTCVGPTLVWLFCIYSIHPVYRRVTTRLRPSRAVFVEYSFLDIDRGLFMHFHLSSFRTSFTLGLVRAIAYPATTHSSCICLFGKICREHTWHCPYQPLTYQKLQRRKCDVFWNLFAIDI